MRLFWMTGLLLRAWKVERGARNGFGSPLLLSSTRTFVGGARDGVASTSNTTKSSSNNNLLTEFTQAKRLADEALALYRKNLASVSSPVSALEHQIADLEREQGTSSFWDDSNAKRAAQVNSMLSSKTRLLSRLIQWSNWEGDVLAAMEMLQLQPQGGGDSDGQASSAVAESSFSHEEMNMLLQELQQSSQLLLKDSQKFELELLLSGPFDASPARLILTAGAGGTEANDWVADLLRMYQRHCQDMEFDVQVEDSQPGDVVGYKSVELLIQGPNAYGWLQGEKGAHRLVRLSPFNSNNKRQTTFAGVDVAPVLDDETVLDVPLPESDLEITTMRAGGKGGQNVNKVNSAVRIKHLPSGLQVKCTQERSQALNKQIALQRLRSQLLAIAQEQRVQEIAQIRGDQVEASWGAQIRNYVLHPYKLVKDQRTGWETSNVQAFLDGDLLKDCIGAYLRYKAKLDAEDNEAS